MATRPSTWASPLERFLRKIQPIESGCWLWQGALNGSGYGRLGVDYHLVRAHRFSYEHFIGLIPSGMEPDHLCRNRACVNPDHLELVTSRQNTLRGDGATAQNARKTTCPKDHPYDYVDGQGRRRCRECRRETYRRKYARRRNQG